MGKTKIEWCTYQRPDGSWVPGYTWNPWWGCTKVSPGCTHCYADSLSTRWGYDIWGPKADRRFFKPDHWKEPLIWQAEAAAAGEYRYVFCASMADLFEFHRLGAVRRKQDEARQRTWDLIATTPNLIWLLLTKRPEQIRYMVPNTWLQHWPIHVYTGTSLETQEEQVRVDDLLRVPGTHFLSCEPLLGPIDLHDLVIPQVVGDHHLSCLEVDVAVEDDGDYHGSVVNWVIAGGESGGGARAMDPEWARDLRDQCAISTPPPGTAFFMKQMGSIWARQHGLKGKADDLHELPEDLRIRQFPPLPALPQEVVR